MAEEKSKMTTRFIDRFDAVLLDMGKTFMFNADRFSLEEDFGETYRRLSGNGLPGERVNEAIRAVFDRLMADYQNPSCYERFPSVPEYLKTTPPSRCLREHEIRLLERVFAVHEAGTIPEVYADTLRRLHETHRLGVVSNIWSANTLYFEEFDRAGVRDLFDVIVFSSDHGCIKPSPRLFAKAIQALGLDRPRLVFVGDSLRCDVAGAKSAGLASVWINADGVEEEICTAQPDLVISDLHDLLDA